MSRELLKMSWFPVFVCARKPVAAIHRLRHALRMENFKNPGISRGGLMYTRIVRETKMEIPATTKGFMI